LDGRKVWFAGDTGYNPVRFKDVGARQSIGMHWGAYPLTAEGPIDPVVELKKQMKARELMPNAFITMAFGETVSR